MGNDALRSPHAPPHVAVARDWIISLVLIAVTVLATLVTASVVVLQLSPSVRPLGSVVTSGVVAALMFGVYLYVTGRSLQYVDLPDLSWSALGIGALAGYGLAVLQGALTFAFVSAGIGDAVGPLGTLVQERGLIFLVSLAAINLLITAPAEELLYRNAVQKTLYRSHSTVSAIVVAAVLFALPHAINSLGAGGLELARGLFEVFLNGIGYGAMYAYWKRIDVTIVAHGVYNCFVFAFAFVV